VNNIDLTQGLADLCVFNQCDKFYDKFKDINNRLTYLQKKDVFINSINLSAINIIMSIAVLISIYIMVPQVHSNLMGGITVAAIILGIMASFECVTPLPNAFQHLGATQESSKRIFEIINADPEIDESNLSSSPKPSNLDLHVKNINFKYSNTSPFALKDISFDLPLGSKIAFVGPSGSGKSSIINLLMKFWNFDEGSIEVDNHSIRKFKQNELNKIFSVSPQNVYMFNESIKNNLLYSNMDASDSDIIESLKKAEIFDFIDSLPKGINTNLGEQGLIFSGGELRRISIARALLSKAPILILDEPTADLDYKTADKIMNNIFDANRERSIILITHILSDVLDKCDNILTFRDGEIIEHGKHKELLEDKNSLYRKMYFKQNKPL